MSNSWPISLCFSLALGSKSLPSNRSSCSGTAVQPAVPAAAWAELFGSYIKHVHVHDNMGDRDAHWGLGKGNLDYKKVIKTIKKNNPKVSFTIECSRKEDVLQSVSELQAL